MLHSWYNSATGANEAEDFLTVSSPISCPALFEDKLHSLQGPTAIRSSQNIEGPHEHLGEFMQHYTANRVCMVSMYAMSCSQSKTIIH